MAGKVKNRPILNYSAMPASDARLESVHDFLIKLDMKPCMFAFIGNTV